MITFHVEPWEQYYADPRREALWLEHYTLLRRAHEDRMDMCPDADAYRGLARAGQLVVVSAREAGELVGYSIFMVRRHLHYSSLCAFEDAYFLTERCRRGGNGVRLIKATLGEIWRRGCRRAFFTTKEFANVGALFARLGGKRTDEVWSFWAPGEE